MRRKTIIAAFLFFMISVIGGLLSPSIEEWWTGCGVDPGQRLVKRLSEYCQAQLHQRALDLARAERDRHENASYRAQILYIEWLANQRMGNWGEAASTESMFLSRYPDHWLGADMRFADAMTLVASADYHAADEKLAMIEARFPDAKVTKEARKIRENLKAKDENRLVASRIAQLRTKISALSNGPSTRE